ncbi:hypothetical protein PAXRUDRAFT_824964 [Paxillus rubicundulus Ve08.2h10]|uniref:Secreted protein n=1 Tax=Paxillus rubicundulus Ve08.2h10 TaxID=930991 RepID=A0A0D0E724_9AGAM|nr:hypothetical protein PAXRUDRAFT_824964 [Paxillus rubicundulus Ve08.2h10]
MHSPILLIVFAATFLHLHTSKLPTAGKNTTRGSPNVWTYGTSSTSIFAMTSAFAYISLTPTTSLTLPLGRRMSGTKQLMPTGQALSTCSRA